METSPTRLQTRGRSNERSHESEDMKSIIQSERVCYKTGRPDVQEHHIFGGANRKNSEKYGLKVWLVREWHTDSPNGVHHNAEFMDELHRVGQQAFENRWGDRDIFLSIFHRNYLDDDTDPACKFDNSI